MKGKTKEGLKVLSANVDVLTTKIVDLHQYEEDQDPCVIALSEVEPKNGGTEI